MTYSAQLSPLATPPSGDDIIVVGQRQTDNTSEFQFATQPISSTDNHHTFDDTGMMPNGQPDKVITVNVHVTNPANLAAAQEAADNWIKALQNIVDAALKVPYNTKITLADGSTITAAQLIDQIASSKFVMTDQAFNGVNGGVGTADHVTMTDTLDYHAFVGSGSYASPNYTNQQGMVGIVLHELSHMSDAGFHNFNAEADAFRTYDGESHVPYNASDFYSTVFAIDNEAFADESAGNIAAGLGIDVNQYLTQRDQVMGGAGEYIYEGAAARLADEEEQSHVNAIHTNNMSSGNVLA